MKRKVLNLNFRKRGISRRSIIKVISVILLLSVSLQSNAQFLGSIVFAEDSSTSATIDISHLRIENNEDIKIDTETLQNTSAMIRSNSYVKTLSKKHYRADEKISIQVVNSSINEIFTVDIKDPGGQTPEIEVAQEVVDDQKLLEINPVQQFRPGKYTVEIKNADGVVISTQDFLWGVLAINTHKSMYLPEETAKLEFAVLDELGFMVCDADLNLSIKNPDGKVDELTTESGKIKVNDQCNKKEFSLTPDFESEYKVSGAGNYEMRLIAETKNGSYSISDSFEVRDYLPFEVERKTVTRIFPPEVYPMEFKIKANEDFSGTITDVVPASFEIIEQDSTKVESFSKIRTIARAAVQGRQVLGLKTDITLPLNEDRQVTAVFGDVVEDPLLKEKYAQYGVLGHDGIDFAVPIGTPIISVDDGEVVLADENGDYGTTLVIEHEWGKSYYGHLSKFEVKVGDKVEKRQLVALSGNTGLSTGPHLHFGIKPKDNDTQNGFFGKIDPSPYLGLPDESSVLGASAVSDIKVKVISWDVNIKKGEEISLGYNYKTPPKSPQFFTLGTAKFFDEDDGKVFEEGRAWQLAIDASNYAGRHIKTIEYSFGNTNINPIATTVPVYATDSGTGSSNGWTTTAPTAASSGFNFQIEGTNIELTDAWIEFRAQTTAAASMSDMSIALSTCPGSVSSCAGTPIYRDLPLLGTTTTVFYFVNSGEHNVLYVKANALGAFDGLSDSDWTAGVETLLRTSATGPSLNLHTAKLILTYTSDFDTATHEEVKTVRFPLSSDVAGDTGSKRTALAAAGNQDFSYNAQIPDLASNSDIVDVYFEISAQASAATTDGSMNARVVSGTPTVSPSYPTITNLGNTVDIFNIFRPTVGTNNFLPNTAQKINLEATTNPIQGAGGELVITYRYSTDEPVQTETVRYFINQNETSGSTAKNTTTINPVISNTGLSVKNIFVRVQGTIGAARNLTVFGDIDAGGGVSEKSNAYTFVFTGTEEIGTQRVIYDMSADAASFVSGGNLSVSTQWSGTLGGPTMTELFITFTWSGDQGGVQTKSVEYYMENSRMGAGVATSAQNQRNVHLGLDFPETATKTLRSAHVENAIVSSDPTTPVNINQQVNQDGITAGGSGFISFANTGEAMSFYVLKDISSSVDVSLQSQSLIYNFISDATAGFSPKAIVTYDVDFSETGVVLPDRHIKTVEYSFGNSNISAVASNGTVYATDTGTGSGNGWTTSAPTLASDGITVKLLGSNIKVKNAWIEMRAQTTAFASMNNARIGLSTCPGSVGTCSSAPAYRQIPLLGNPASISYYMHSSETNIVYMKANAVGAFEGLSDSNWATGVETLMSFVATGPSLNSHTAKLVITYESDYESTAHDEIKTVRFPISSDVSGDTGSKRTQLAAGGNQDFSYFADIPDLASNSDIYDVFFEIGGQTGSTTGSMTARVVSGAQTNSPSFVALGGATVTTQGNFYNFRPTVGTNNFLPNTAQKININATTTAVNGLGGELVVTYKYSTSAPVQTETVRYFADQRIAHGSNAKNTATIAPVISNTGAQVKNIYARVQAHNVSASNLTVFGDIDAGGGVTEKSNQYAFIFAGEQIGQNRVIYDMSADAASFVSGGNMSISTQWSNTSGGPPSVEVFITFTWDGDQGGVQTKSVEYYMENSQQGSTTGATAQALRSIALNMIFPESVTKILRSAYVENAITGSMFTTQEVNSGFNEDTITSSGTGTINYTNTGEAMSFYSLEDASTYVSVNSSFQSIIFNYISTATSAFSPVGIVTYDADFPAATSTPGISTFYPEDGTNQIAFNNIRQNSSTPTFRASATHTSTFDRFQLELNPASDFSGTAYTQTFSNTYSSATEYNLTASSLSPSLPTTNGVTYYARVRASADSGANWGSWSSGTWAYTYKSSGDAEWFQTTDEQFDTGTLTGVETTGSDSVMVTGSGGGPVTPTVDYSDITSAAANTNPTWTPSGGTLPAGKLVVALLLWANHPSPSGTMTLPSGWNTWPGYNAGNVWGSSSTLGACLCYKYTGGSEPSSYTWTKSGTINYWEMSVVVIDGAHPTTPFTVTPSANLGSDNSVEHLSVTTTTDNNLIVLFGANEVGGLTITPPGGYSEIEDDGVMWVSHAVKSTAGAVGNQTTSLSAGASWISLMAAVNPADSVDPTGTIMSPVIDFDWYPGAASWDTFDWNEDETDGDISAQLYYTDSTTCDTIVPDGALSGNSSGFTTGPIDISGLNTTTYNEICLLATLEYDGGTPYLEDWLVTWNAGSGPETPSLSQLMRHGRWFNSSGVIQPFTF